MKRSIILTLIALCIMLPGCAKCISTRQEEIEVVITDVYFRPFYSTPIKVGNVWTFANHPAIYRTYIECEHGKFTISGSGIYHTFKDKVGQTAIGTLETKIYDDGDVKYRITSIQEDFSN